MKATIILSTLLFVRNTAALDCKEEIKKNGKIVARKNAEGVEECLCPKFKKKNADGTQCIDPECKENERWTIEGGCLKCPDESYVNNNNKVCGEIK